MSGLSVGIVGLPNAGKSTLFNALLGRAVANTAPYPFCTIEPNVGVVEVEDEYLDQLVEVLEPQENISAAIEFVDIAGLVDGAHEGEGLGNEFLSHIREVNVILHLVRAFKGTGVESVGSTNPYENLQIVNTELMLKDMETVSRVCDHKLRANDPDKFSILKRVLETLEDGYLANKAVLSEKEEEKIRELNLLTLKPQLLVLNVDEDKFELYVQGTAAPDVFGEEVSTFIKKNNPLVISAKFEEDIAEFSEEERLEYLGELGVASGLDRVIEASYNLLELITFYTVKGGEIIRAWPIKRGSSVLEAAETVHSDFAENFIRAEVLHVEKLIEFGSWRAAKEVGAVEVCGRDYKVQDADVIEFKI